MADEDVQETSINIACNLVKFKHCYTIEDYPNLIAPVDNVFIKLPTFSVVLPNTKNEIFFYIELNPDESGYLSVRLNLESELDHALTTFKFSVLNDKNEAMFTCEQRTKIFNTTQRESNAVNIKDADNIDDYLYDNVLRISVEGTVSEKITSPVKSTRYLKISEKEIAEDLALLFINQELSDVTVSASGKEIKVHKAILAARSPVFKAMFSHETEENTENRVEITDLHYEVLKDMLHFMYTGQTLTVDTMAGELLAAAEKYAILGLKLICEKTLRANITIENAAQMIILADLYNSQNLRDDALNFIKINGIQVMKTMGWVLLTEYPKLITEILHSVFTK